MDANSEAAAISDAVGRFLLLFMSFLLSLRYHTVMTTDYENYIPGCMPSFPFFSFCNVRSLHISWADGFRRPFRPDGLRFV